MIQQPTSTAGYSGYVPAQQQRSVPDSLIKTGVMSFFSSLRPGYVSDPSRGVVEFPVFCADSPDQQGYSLLQRTELAARVICAYAGLPQEVVSFVGGLANISAAARWVDSKRADLLASRSSAANGHEEHVRKKQQRAATCRQSAPLPKTALALGAASCLGAVGAQEQWIEVRDADTLNKIGRDPAFPLDGRYRQMAEIIDASGMAGSIGNESHPFVGEYDGRCKEIHNLRHCFVKKLDGNGHLHDQVYVFANVVSEEQAGVVACQISGKSRISNTLVDNGHVTTTGSGSPAGLAAAISGNETRIDGFRTMDVTTVTTRQKESHAGLVVGRAWGAVKDSRIEHSTVETFHSTSDAGLVAGVTGNSIHDSVIIDSKVHTHGDRSNAGGGAGHALSGADINNTLLIECRLVTEYDLSSAGGGAGKVDLGAKVNNTLLIRTNLKTFGNDGDAGGGVGQLLGYVGRTTMVGGEVSTNGDGAQAGGGAGEVFSSGRVERTTVRHAIIKTSGAGADAGGGAGRVAGRVSQTLCDFSEILTSNTDADAAVGGGWGSGSVDEIVSRNCEVITSGDGADAGLGMGGMDSAGTVQGLKAVYSSAEASGNGTKVGINAGDDSFACYTAAGDYEAPVCCDEYHNNSCLRIPDGLCGFADSRVLDAQCQPMPLPKVDLDGVGALRNCPDDPEPTAAAFTSRFTADAATTSTPVSSGTATRSGKLTVAPSISATATPSTPDLSASLAPVIASTTPSPSVLPTLASVNVTDVSGSNVSFPVAPSLIPLSSAAPLVLTGSALGTGSLVGITLGALGVVGLLGGGFALYRYYHNSGTSEAQLLPLTVFDEQ